jgi:hypothetical protein
MLVRTKNKPRDASIEHMAILKVTPQHVTNHFHDLKVKYAA